MTKRLGRAVQICLGLGVGLALLEVGFRVRDQHAFPHLNIYQPDAQLGVRLRPHARTRVAFGGSAVTLAETNGAGFRCTHPCDDAAERAGEILFVGDSQTFGLGVQAEESFASRLGVLAKRPVYNAGVPTWGPSEFAAIIDEVGQRRRPSTIVYVVNFANDAFEVNHPNSERHVAWDGWAVRRELAPRHVTQFPGRQLLFRSSHLVFAGRQWWHTFGGKQLDERGTPSEGTFRDLVDLGLETGKRVHADDLETRRRESLYELETTYAEESYRKTESRVRALVWSAFDLGGAEGEVSTYSQGNVYLAADANPGDIVTPGYGEEGRPVFATAKYIREAIGLRNKLEQRLRERAERAIGSEEAKEIMSALSARDAHRLKTELVHIRPLEAVRHASPLLRSILDAKRRSAAFGAELVLLVLPLDVMVSNAEWPKHGGKGVDLTAGNVLITDLVQGARAASIRTLDATQGLRAAEPGAFLPGDIHLTPKGHAAVADGLMTLLRTPAEQQSAPLTRLVLKPGRSRVPPHETWRAVAGEIAVVNSRRCPVTKKYREWLYVRCFSPVKGDPVGVSLQVTRGGQGDAITSVAGEAMTLVAPIPRGEPLEAVFTWSDGVTKRLIVDWDEHNLAPDLRMVAGPAMSPVSPLHSEAAEQLCACHKSERKTDHCGELIAQPDTDCLRTYAGKCGEALACAEGNPLYPPSCLAGAFNSGATSRCIQGEAPPAPELSDWRPASVSAGPSGDPARVQALGRDVIARAQAFVGAGCRLGSGQVEFFTELSFDQCPIDAAMVSAYVSAFAEFQQLARSEQEGAELRSFFDKASWFSSWVQLALVSHDTRGTAALYQELAISFNAWQPKNGVFVDSERMIDLYFGLSGIHANDFLRNLPKDGEKRKAAFLASGKHLVWRRGPGGFEGPYLSVDERFF